MNSVRSPFFWAAERTHAVLSRPPCCFSTSPSEDFVLRQIFRCFAAFPARNWWVLTDHSVHSALSGCAITLYFAQLDYCLFVIRLLDVAVQTLNGAVPSAKRVLDKKQAMAVTRYYIKNSWGSHLNQKLYHSSKTFNSRFGAFKGSKGLKLDCTETKETHEVEKLL